MSLLSFRFRTPAPPRSCSCSYAPCLSHRSFPLRVVRNGTIRPVIFQIEEPFLGTVSSYLFRNNRSSSFVPSLMPIDICPKIVNVRPDVKLKVICYYFASCLFHTRNSWRMAGSALRRLMAEYKQLTLNPPEGIIAGPINEENFFEWEALITGPEGTCFEGGVFPAKLIFPADYPLSPPKMQFTCEMFHPNIYADGRVCISILHAPGDDPMGYESSAERWSPVQSVEKILLSVVSMLAEPNDESGANVDAAKMWRENRTEFNRIAERIVRRTLGIPT